MSDIKRYGVWDKPPREDLVTYADHEAAIALRTRVCAEAFEDELARTEERVLADAKARIEAERIESDGMDSWENGYHVGIEAALAALTQPQTEIEGKPDGTWYDIPDGGGAATAAGARGADLEGDEPSETEAVARVKAVMKAGRDAGSGVFDSNSVFRFGTHGVAALLNFLERDGWEVIHTGVYAQPQKWIQAEAELEDQPTPYAEAFRERVCPVPEFPSVEKGTHE